MAISGCMCSFDIEASIIDIDAYDRVHFDDGRIARLVGITNLNVERLLEHFAPFRVYCDVVGEVRWPPDQSLPLVDCTTVYRLLNVSREALTLGYADPICAEWAGSAALRDNQISGCEPASLFWRSQGCPQGTAARGVSLTAPKEGYA